MQNKRTSKPLLVSLLCSKPFYALKFADYRHVDFGAFDCFSQSLLTTMMMMDRNLILEPCNIFGHFVPPEDKQTQVENSSKTEKTTASYSSGLHWECLVSDVCLTDV